MLRPKKNSYKEFDNEKKFLRLKNSPPPHNFSNGPSLIRVEAGTRDLGLRAGVGDGVRDGIGVGVGFGVCVAVFLFVSRQVLYHIFN